MPFDPAPQPQKIEVGQFQKFADAMLRGCAITRPIVGAYLDGDGGACALGALFVGLGLAPSERWEMEAPSRFCKELAVVRNEYEKVYNTDIPKDNDLGILTREQIAARIAAL